MKNLKLGMNFAIFILFFGLALLEAIRTQDWFLTAIYMVLAAVFLWADMKKS